MPTLQALDLAERTFQAIPRIVVCIPQVLTDPAEGMSIRSQCADPEPWLMECCVESSSRESSPTHDLSKEVLLQ